MASRSARVTSIFTPDPAKEKRGLTTQFSGSRGSPAGSESMRASGTAGCRSTGSECLLHRKYQFGWPAQETSRGCVKSIGIEILFAKRISIPIDFTQPLDVSWAGHPNWYFRWSKHSLPVLRHPAVPEARMLSDPAGLPRDPENWVVKPLFSFAGSGVKMDVTRADLDAIPREEWSRTLLMRKVFYAP